MSKFAVLGYGVVGSGVVELFYKNKEKIEQKAGHEMDVKYILDIREFPATSVISFAARHLCSGRMIGMAPPTLASK